jgi:hypothetical protein
MIPKNLKVGDTFTDGGFTYVVDEIVSVGYNSHRIEKPVKIPEIKEEVKEEPGYTKTQVNRLPNAELEKLCEKLGLEIGTGTEMKRAIIAKLGL